MKNSRTIYWKKVGQFFLVLLVGTYVSSCDLQSTGSDSNTGTPTDTGTPPPSQIVGTAALAGESATFSLNPSSVPSSSVVNRKALYNVSGTIRYRSTDFALTGTYESVTKVISVTSVSVSVSGISYSFKIMGTYAPSEGFSGTIEQYKNGTKSLVGSVTGQIPTQTGSATNYLGTFSGGAGGTWNLTLQGNTFSGTYANYDPEKGNGTFSGTVSGSTLSLTKATNSEWSVVSFSGGGTLSGTTFSGTWKTTLSIEGVNETFSGIWSGAAATSQGDSHTPTSGDPLPYKFSLICQAINLAAISTGVDFETAGTYGDSGSVQCTVAADTPTEGYNRLTMNIHSDFTDPVRGIILKAGSVVMNEYKMPEVLLVKTTATNLSFDNSPIQTLSMEVTVNNETQTISGTLTVDGTVLTEAERNSLKDLFF